MYNNILLINWAYTDKYRLPLDRGQSRPDSNPAGCRQHARTRHMTDRLDVTILCEVREEEPASVKVVPKWISPRHKSDALTRLWHCTTTVFIHKYRRDNIMSADPCDFLSVPEAAYCTNNNNNNGQQCVCTRPQHNASRRWRWLVSIILYTFCIMYMLLLLLFAGCTRSTSSRLCMCVCL